MDHYLSFRELAAAEPDADFGVLSLPRLESRILVMAPHGGAIEPATSELAAAIASDDLSLYDFHARRSDDTHRLHITSTRFDEPTALAMLESAHIVVTVHGLADRSAHYALIGGRHTELREAAITALRESGFEAHSAVGTRYAGLNPANICNRGSTGRGLQLELSRALREELRENPIRLQLFACSIRQALVAAGIDAMDGEAAAISVEEEAAISSETLSLPSTAAALR